MTDRMPAASTSVDPYLPAAPLAALDATGCHVVHVGGRTVALFRHGDEVHAVDNRCPHMGFPLDRGSLQDGILTCHWHHARFDLATGGTFDTFADDVQTFPVRVSDGHVYVDVTPRADPAAHHRERLASGLERDIPLVIAKAAIGLGELGAPPVDAFRIGLAFGARYRAAGWGQGLTMLTCFHNLLPALDPADRPLAVTHGLSAVARDSAGAAPRFPLPPLPGAARDMPTYRRWYRRFVEVRDEEGAERCLVSAVAAGADAATMADLLFAAATDHRYIQIGHVLDFTNKALEALDAAGWEHAALVLPSLARGYAFATRQEEANAWRHPIDLVALLEAAFDRLPAALESGAARRDHADGADRVDGRAVAPAWRPSPDLTALLLSDAPAAIVDALVDALADGADPAALASEVAYAAARRMAHFGTANEFGDWDTVLHTFTFANAVEMGLRRAPSPELVRGVFDAAMSVYLDRFLNTPAAPLPDVGPGGGGGMRADVRGDGAADAATASSSDGAIVADLAALLDRQQQVDAAGRLVANHLARGGAADRVLAALGHALLREDRDFHTIQAVEAAVRQHALRRGTPEGAHVLVGAARYLAAHAPTARAQGQSYGFALRLARGEQLFV